MMTKRKFEQLKSQLHTIEDVNRQTELQKDSVSFDTLFAIYILNKQASFMRDIQQFKKLEGDESLLARFYSGKSLLMIAIEHHVPPCVVARRVLEDWLSEKQVPFRGAIKNIVKQYLNNVALINDERLRNDVCECISSDESSSPLVDKIRSIGLEYEFVLQEHLLARGITYWSEEDLRKQGSTKTPDILLCSPIKIYNHDVNWIESKAVFADEQTHGTNFAQFSGYLNRWGPGMVIYWFGFVQEIQELSESILITDRFPDASSIVTLTAALEPSSEGDPIIGS